MACRRTRRVSDCGPAIRSRASGDPLMNKQVILHPFLFALFPAFFLFGANDGFFEFSAVLRPAALTLAVVSIVWVASFAIVRDKRQSAIAISLTVLGLFSFQAVSDTLSQVGSKQGIQTVSTAHQIIVGSLIFALGGSVLCIRLKKYLDQITYLMNVVGTILVAVPMMTVTIGRLVGHEAAKLIPDRKAFEAILDLPVNPAERPDIYYIVLDGYGRADFLREEFDFDNSGLIRHLKENNFYVASQSHSNYSQTLLSIASSLNFAYLDEALGKDLADLNDRRYLRDLLRDNRTVHLLKKAGYSTVQIASESHEAEIRNPDRYVSKWWSPTLLESGLLNMTPVPWAFDKAGEPLFYDLHRENILYAIEELGKTPAIPGPKFVYAHILVGHPPFVFGPNGEPVTPDRPYSCEDGDGFMAHPGESRTTYRESYRGQVTFLNERLKPVLETILAHSEQPPIIIVQGDHGPGSSLNSTTLEDTDARERFSILNAYHLPGRTDAWLYDSVTPVNTFRIVLNRYFGTDLPLLEDKSFYAPFLRPYAFTFVDPAQLGSQLDPGMRRPAELNE